MKTTRFQIFIAILATALNFALTGTAAHAQSAASASLIASLGTDH
jgi:hypothetical protein